MPKPTIYYPVRPFHINQHFGGNLPCVKDFGLPTQDVITGTETTCPVGYDKLYAHWGMAGHNGTDLMAGEQPVYAAMNGVVIEQQLIPSRGLGIGILTNEQYDFGDLGTHYLKLRYWHLKSFNVQAGNAVKIGDVIGTSNNTGYSSGNHLHFEGQLMDKDAGGHPVIVNYGNGYFGAINIEPYLSDKFIFTKNLWLGQSNGDVLALQGVLGVYPQTGFYGPKTFSAVVQYQKSKGIIQTGVVGPLTRASLNS